MPIKQNIFSLCQSLITFCEKKNTNKAVSMYLTLNLNFPKRFRILLHIFPLFHLQRRDIHSLLNNISQTTFSLAFNLPTLYTAFCPPCYPYPCEEQEVLRGGDKGMLRGYGVSPSFPTPLSICLSLTQFFQYLKSLDFFQVNVI